jgi:hypothetical protein
LHVLSTPPAFVLSQDQTLRECIPVIGTTPRERNRRKEYPACSQRPRCAPPPHNRREDFFKGTSSSKTHAFDRRGINISGVDFWHAVEFSRNGHFLCTHPPTRQAFLRAFPFGVTDSIRSFRSRFPVDAGVYSAVRPFDIHHVSRLPAQLLIGTRSHQVNGIEFRHAKFDPR